MMRRSRFPLILLLSLNTAVGGGCRNNPTPSTTFKISSLPSPPLLFLPRALKQKNDPRLDTAAGDQGDGRGTAIVPGKSGESLLIDAVTGAEGVEKMPPEGEPLTPEQIAALRAWIDQGAKAPVEKTPEDPARHWSYQPPVRAPLPVPRDATWVRNPIDAFVAAEHDRQGLKPSPAIRN